MLYTLNLTYTVLSVNYTSIKLEEEIKFFFKKVNVRNFPVGPVVKTPCSQYRRPEFDPW